MTLGCSRIDTGWYFSTPFGGRPRLGRFLPSFRSIALRAASASLAVSRRARSKGNSLGFFIADSLFPAGTPCADEAVGVVRLPDREDDDHDSDVRFSDQPTALLVCRGMLPVGGNERERIVECRDRILETYTVLGQVRLGLPTVPVEPHLRYIPQCALRVQSRSDDRIVYVGASSSALASMRSRVAKPSVNVA